MSEMRQRKGGDVDSKIAELKKQQQNAIEAEDFDEAKRLKAEIANLQGNDTVAVSSAATAKNPGSENQDGDDSNEYSEQIARTLQKSLESAQNVKPGVTHETQNAKNALAKDPYNLMLMYDLARSYAEEHKWEQSVNVMIRGWKRTGELEDPRFRIDYLLSLSNASYHIGKYRQALAVLNDINEDEADDDARKPLDILKCKVHCANGDLTRGLKAFNKAIEGEPFNEAAGIWAQCAVDLKKANGYEPTKEAMSKLAKGEEETKKLDALEKLVDLRMAVQSESERRKLPGSSHAFFVGKILFFVIFIVILVTCLHKLESRSLAQLSNRPDGGK